MTDHRTLGELEQAHDDAMRTARERVQQAEEYVTNYRMQMNRMQEDFYNLATQQGVVHDPGFREEFQRVSDGFEENVREAARVIAGFEEELDELSAQHTREREDFLQNRRDDNDNGRR